MPDVSLIRQLQNHREEIISKQVEALLKQRQKIESETALSERAEIALSGVLAYIQNRDRKEVARLIDSIRRHFSSYNSELATSSFEFTAQVIIELTNLSEILKQIMTRELSPKHRMVKKLEVRMDSLILLVQLVSNSSLIFQPRHN
ncbi:MAG: hypothetical protein HXX08_00850 [Chloroflexi bacterium]|uniref:Uncharacterized protein n=1 Tax=Candidatus Chlorohelix allophototropha TaxID=3003348 RepID=A0A8T7LU51_9CHLR|nr:hypothetical protein [Chloroflexota bacterium]WJW66295.1 hypothetical protein OZ401_002089 [Chloroflexota bacterium L227-S17]